MYAAPFEYHSPASLAEAAALLEKLGDDAKVLAGSQSLVPLMKLRLATPKHVVDLRKVPGIAGVTESSGALLIGAMTTHADVAASPVVKEKLPVLSEAASEIGDPQVRNLGTIGGSLAHADPSADWPAVLLALDATVKIASARGERTARIDELIEGPLTSSLSPGEIVVQVKVPLPPAKTGAAYEKMPHPASRFAIVGAAAVITLDKSGAVASARVALTGLAPKVARARAVEQALAGKRPDPAALKAAAARAADGIDVRGELIGSADYKRNLAAVYTERGLKRAVSRALER